MPKQLIKTTALFVLLLNNLQSNAQGTSPCTAIAIDTGQCINSNNTGFPTSGYNPGCASYTGGDVWFTMQVPLSGNLSFVTDSGSITDTGLAVWTDTSCTNPQVIGCDDDSGNGYFSFLTLYDLTPGQTLYLQIWGYGGATGTFQLCVNDLGTVVLDSSEIPIVMINTLGQTIIQGTKINCLMDIKYNGPGSITYVSDSSNVYSGNIGIEIRGASSASYLQHPYGIETRDTAGVNKNVALLGMPLENDWVLISNFNDRSLIRNALAYKLFGEMGNYAPRTKLCEVLIDSTYEGIYAFGENIKRDVNRVKVAKLTTATSGDSLTGGYILQQNYFDASNSFQSNYSPIDHPGFDVHFLYHYPDPATILPVQKTYIASFVDSLETALYSANYADSATGYRKYLDVKSFIDYFLVNELARNGDGFKKSVFFNKNKFSKGGKLKAGPVWDFDWAWKNLYQCSVFENTNGSGWAHHINDCPTDNYSTGWYIRLLQDTTFNNQLRCTYENYRQTILDTTHIFNYIDSIRNLVHNAQARHFQKWPILGMSGPAPEIAAIATTYDAELDTLKFWINTRLQWLDANIPGLCIPSSAGIAQKNMPANLHYYPNPSTGIIHFEDIPKSETPLQITVYDAAGKIVDEVNLALNNSKFNYNLNKKGFFYFTLSNKKEIIHYGKFIIM